MTLAPALAASRRGLLLERLARNGVLRVAELAAELGVTPVTIRRDLVQLEDEGLLTRVHGGAVPPEFQPEPEAPSASGTIAVLVPSLDYYWPGVIRGMEDAARACGMRILLRGSSYEPEDERPVLKRLLLGESVRGLVFAPNADSPYAPDVVAWLAREKLPCVLVERDAVRPDTREPFESVTTDHAHGAILAAQHLADLGHRRVGLLLSRFSPTSRKIATGWKAACRQLGLDRTEHFEQIIPDRRTTEFATALDQALDTALESGTTGLLVHSDPEAIALVERALGRGIRVPGDLSIIAYDDEVADLYYPALTAVSPPRAAVGQAAVELITRRLADPDCPGHRVLLSPSLVQRESTAPVRK